MFASSPQPIRLRPRALGPSLAAAFFFFALPGLPAGGSAPMTRSSLEPKGKPSIEVFDHFDGNGVRDILLADDRTFSLFLCGPKGPPAKPSLVLRAPAGPALFDVADLDGDGVREIVLLARDGVSVVRPPGRRAGKEGEKETPSVERVLAARSRLIPRRVTRLTFADFIRDVTGDGAEDIIFPDLDRFVIFAASGKGSFEKWCEIPYRPRAEFHGSPLSDTGTRREMLHLPLLMAGGGVKGRRLILYDGSRLRVLERDGTAPPKEILDRELYDTKTEVDADRDVRMRFHSNVFFEDLDGDGKGDLVLCDNSKGEVRFFNAIESERLGRPDLVIKVEGNTLSPVFSDLDGDGLEDLILPSAGKIGLFTILKVFFTSRFDMNFMVFFNHKNPLFRMVPEACRTLSVPLSFTTSKAGISVASVVILSFTGDFNGDGRRDFLLREKEDTIDVFFGREDGAFPSRPDMAFKADILPGCYQVTTRTEDVDGDGLSDLYLHQKSEAKETWDVYLSGGGN